jgi:hypothetical protein
MKKLALRPDDLSVQSFPTTPSLRDLRCTVRAHQESWDEHACSDGCTLAFTCYSCESCADPCVPPPTETTDTADPNRRVILY